MRILYVSQYFPPEIGATQARAREMARGLVRAGHEVTVLTEFPNHPKGVIPESYRGRWIERVEEDGVEIVRVRVAASPSKSSARRMLFYGSFVGMAVLTAIFRLRGHYDVAYVTSPPLFVGMVGLVLRRLRGLPMVFEVRDPWPEAALELGELRQRWAIRLLYGLQRSCYRRALHVVAVTEGFRRSVLDRGVAPEDVSVIPNGVNTDLFRPLPRDPVWRERFGIPSDRFVVAYTGLHGLANSLETIIEAARILADDPDFFFLLVGEGPRKDVARERVREAGLANVAFHAAVAEGELPRLLAEVDVGLDCRGRMRLSEGTLPVKMFSYLACEVPVALAIEGEAERLVRETGAGVVVPPESPEPLAEAIRSLRDDPERRAEMGRRGRRLVEQRFSRSTQAEQLATLLAEVTK